MSATEKKLNTRVRKPRRNLAEERKRVVIYCRISLQVIGQMSKGAPESMGQFLTGRADAFYCVLKELGEEAS